MTDPAYCQLPPPPKLPEPRFPEPEAAATAAAVLHEVNKLPVDFDRWHGERTWS